MITLPPIKKKEIPRQYFAAVDHLRVVFSSMRGMSYLKKAI